MAPKRKSLGDDTAGTPKKVRSNEEIEEVEVQEVEQAQTPSKQRTVAETPSKQRSILKNAHLQLGNGDETPKSLRKVLFSTPAKALETVPETATESPLTAARNADRSARKKSTRTLFYTGHGEQDEEEDVGEDVAQQILDDEDEGASELLEEDEVDEGPAAEEEDTIVVAEAPETPSKEAKLRGRPKGKRRARSPTPPNNLPPHELYFFQNRPGGVKTSTNTLPSAALLNHDDYFAQINAYKDTHEDDMAILTNMHKASFEQWALELEEGFNICLYGYGSKRQLLLEFADYLHQTADDPRHPPKIIIVNGYNPSLALRDILTTLSSTLLGPTASQKLPQQPTAHIDALLAALRSRSPHNPIHLLIHSIDAPPLRKYQLPLSRLASSPHISLTATADIPTFPLLWDISLRSAFHFLFHDTTTFRPYTAELDPVDEVNALLGRSGRRVGGKDGVAYVLRSLPENARNLYRILVAEQLALADSLADGDGFATPGGFGEDDDELDRLGHVDDGDDRFDMDIDVDVDELATPSKRTRKGRPAKRSKPSLPKPAPLSQNGGGAIGVEYRTLYHKAVEEFVCSSEMSFRTLLKEFHDHAMLESKRDASGTERLSVPFGREELEEILGELV